METKSIYLSHKELCEMFDIPEESALLADEYALIYWLPAEMWKLSINVGTQEEVDQSIT